MLRMRNEIDPIGRCLIASYVLFLLRMVWALMGVGPLAWLLLSNALHERSGKY